MFHTISPAMLARMKTLEETDARDRADGTPRPQRLRQIPPETGQFLALLAASTPAGQMLEIGTSAGYSSMWLSLACEATGRTLRTFELLPAKIELARATFKAAQVEHLITLVEGDVLDHLPQTASIAFCFLDTEKELYAPCYEIVIPKLVPGGLLIADNAINHRETLQPFLDRALADPRVDALIVPIGKGVLVCRKI